MIIDFSHKTVFVYFIDLGQAIKTDNLLKLMQMKCPKCGFIQPEDQFCARCGIDVKTFLTTPNTWYQNLFKNAFFWLIMIVLTLSGGVYYLKIDRQNELQKRAYLLKRGPLFVETRANKNKLNQNTNLKEPSLPTQSSSAEAETHTASANDPRSLSATSTTALNEIESALPTPPPAQGASGDLPSTASFSSETKADSKEDLKQEPKGQTKNEETFLQVTYYEVPEDDLNKTFEKWTLQNSPFAIDFGDYRSAPLLSRPDTSKWSRLKSKKIQITSNQLEYRWFEGNQDSELGISFLSQVQFQSAPSTLHSEIEIVKFFPDEQGIVNPQPLPNTVIELPSSHKGYWLITIKLPKALPRTIIDALKDPVFNILTSEAYIKAKSEFTILLEYSSTNRDP